MRIYGWEFLVVLHHPVKWGDHRHCESGDMFLVSLVTTSLRCYVTLWVEASHGKSPPCHVGGYRSCAIGDIKYLSFHVASQNHVFERSCNFMSGNSTLYVTILPSFVAIGIVIVEICF